MHVVATAGHVDHGKSTLVKVLTGTDPDRLQEEKRRGLTIDLGFAWLDLPHSGRVSIVDVPGHERFIRNMLAGVGSVDTVLFTVAATEGWKPQSQEHLDILDLLGVASGVIAITRVAEVSAEQVERVETDVRSKLKGTSLADAPIVGVATVEGVGLEALRQALDEALVNKPPRPDVGRPRLWVDRVFTMKGQGTVVTGTLTDGWIRNDDEVELLPGGRRSRVRGLQSQKHAVAEAAPGSRLAMNLGGLSVADVARGDVITAPGAWNSTATFLAKVRLLDGLTADLLRKGAFKVHVGSAALDADIRLIEDEGDGYAKAVLVRVSTAIPLQAFDRFVIRESGRRATVGGGIVLDSDAEALGRHTRDLLAAYQARKNADTPALMLEAVLDDGPLLKHRALIRAGERNDVAVPSGVLELDGVLIARRHLDSITTEIEEHLDVHHASHPMETGLDISALRERLPSAVLQPALELLRSSGKVVVESGRVRRSSHTAPSETLEAQEVLRSLEDAASSPPPIDELRARFGPSLIASLEREGKVVRVSDQLLFSASWLDELARTLTGHVDAHGPFTVAEFRDLIATTRKFAVPLLEYLDRKRITIRSGDHRTIGPGAKGGI